LFLCNKIIFVTFATKLKILLQILLKNCTIFVITLIDKSKCGD